MTTLPNVEMSELEALSLPELKDLQKKVRSAITDFEARRRREALAAVEAKAKEMGFTLAELAGGKKAKSAKPTLPAKYVNPDNAEETWSGKGRRPHWFMAAIEAGKSPEDLEV